MPRWINQDLLDRQTVQAFVLAEFDHPLDEELFWRVHDMKLNRSNPSLWSMDALMVNAGRHLNEFFDWARAKHVRIWAHDEPSWHRCKPDWNEIDKTWPDPESAE